MTDAARGAGNESNLAVELHGMHSSMLEIIVNDSAAAECRSATLMRRRERRDNGTGFDLGDVISVVPWDGCRDRG
jgi:hypothetical protein